MWCPETLPCKSSGWALKQTFAEEQSREEGTRCHGRESSGHGMATVLSVGAAPTGCTSSTLYTDFFGVIPYRSLLTCALPSPEEPASSRAHSGWMAHSQMGGNLLCAQVYGLQCWRCAHQLPLTLTLCILLLDHERHSWKSGGILNFAHSEGPGKS